MPRTDRPWAESWDFLAPNPENEKGVISNPPKSSVDGAGTETWTSSMRAHQYQIDSALVLLRF
jgi:hypothetical protein